MLVLRLIRDIDVYQFPDVMKTFHSLQPLAKGVSYGNVPLEHLRGSDE